MKYFFLGVVGLFASSLWAQNVPMIPFSLKLGSGISGQYDFQTGISNEEQLSIVELSQHLDINMGLEINNDRKYGSDVIYLKSTNNLGNYLLVQRGDITLRDMGFELQAGRFLPIDAVDTPYSLVFNPNALAQMGMKLSYKLGPFTYSTQWVQLNSQSNFGSVDQTPPAWQYTWNGQNYVQNGTGFPDRGIDVHSVILELGGWKFGIQDQSIYSGRSFDSEYFFSPMPQYFTEYLRSVSGRPWTADSELDKYMIGFFTTWKGPNADALVQFQMADFNLHFLDPSVFPNNPAKYAWSVGGHVTNDWGRWGLFQAGATKYMYEAMTISQGQETFRDVGNFYFPDTVYNLNGSFVPVDLQTNEIGYTNGENNVALMATWDKLFDHGRVNLGSTLEFILAGDNAPANPWQGELTTPTSNLGTQLLNDPVLEKSIQATFQASVAYGNWTFSTHFILGMIFNVLALQDAPGASQWSPTGTLSPMTALIQNWVPSSQNQPILTASIGVKYSFDATPIVSGWFDKVKNN